MTTVIDMRSHRNRLPRDTFALRLAIVRHEMGWNFREAASAAGVSHQSWQNWENGKPCSTMERTCEKLADATGFSYTWLIAGGPLGGGNLPPDDGPLAQLAELRTFNPKSAHARLAPVASIAA